MSKLLGYIAVGNIALNLPFLGAHGLVGCGLGCQRPESTRT